MFVWSHRHGFVAQGDVGCGCDCNLNPKKCIETKKGLQKSPQGLKVRTPYISRSLPLSFHPTKTNLTYEECEKLIHDEVFRLRPSDYGVLHPKWPGLVGLELEMVPLRAAGGRPVSLFGELAGELLALADEQESWTPEYKDSQLQRIALGEGDQLTFEPGGQLEISSKPYPCLSEAVLRLREVRKALENRLNPKGFYLLQHGVNPFHSPEELGLQLQTSQMAVLASRRCVAKL